MKAAVVLDSWKLEIFERHLKQSGYTYENVGAFTPGTVLLKVTTENPEALRIVLEAATKEAARTKSRSGPVAQ